MLMLARGGVGFQSPLHLVESGPYDPGFSPGATVLTQLHCHTTQSDGANTPAAVVAFYAAAGYGALQLTDHDKITAQPAGITSAIVGNEYSPTENHIIGTGITSYLRGSTTLAQTIVNNIVSNGGIAHVAHPNWLRGMTFAELDALTGHAGIEVHNTHCIPGANQNPISYPGYATALWDQLLTNSPRRNIWGFSVDDLHSVNAFDTYDTGRIQVFAASNTPSNVKTSIANGNFVADVSNYGVTPGYPDRDGSSISLTCSGATRIEAYGTGGALLAAADADTLDYRYAGGERYVRLVAIGQYDEAFSSALSSRWQAAEGSWSVSSGVVAVSTDSQARRLILRRHREGDWDGYVDARLQGGGQDRAALMFNVLNTDYYMMAMFGESSATGYNNTFTVSWTHTDSFSAATNLIGSAAFVASQNVWYRIKLQYTASSGRIRAKIWDRDNVTEPDWMIDANYTGWRHGAFGLRANRTTQFDNLHLNGFQTLYQPVQLDAA